MINIKKPPVEVWRLTRLNVDQSSRTDPRESNKTLLFEGQWYLVNLAIAYLI